MSDSGSKIPGAAGNSNSNVIASEGRRYTDGDEFPRAVGMAAVSQICDSAGFHSIQRSALDALVDIAVRYLEDIGKVAHFYARLAGRTEYNALDVIFSLEDLGMFAAVAGSAELYQPLSSSVALKDVMRFVKCSVEMPFSKPLPHFPVCKKRRLTPSFIMMGEEPPHPHIPPWLPAFPDPHTYRSMPLWNERKAGSRMEKLEQAKRRRKAERTLVSLHLRLSSHAAVPSTEPSSSLGLGRLNSSRPLLPPSAPREQLPSLARLEGCDSQNKGKARRSPTGIQSPFVIPPFPVEAKEVRSALVKGTSMKGAKQKVERQLGPLSSLEAFTPALEAVRNGFEQSQAASSNSLCSILPDAKSRGPILLTFDFGRKVSQMAVAANLSLGTHHSSLIGKDRKRSCHTSGQVKPEKKRRAEQILAQAMEGTEDIAQ